jgi:putative nucleotidyltransferase with HDIG domain
LAAALLHDIGKTRYPLSVWDRILIVVGGALFPGRASAWGNGSLDGWRRPFVVRAHHPAWGAEMAAAAGSRGRVVELIRRHQDELVQEREDDDRLLARLQWADDQS